MNLTNSFNLLTGILFLFYCRYYYPVLLAFQRNSYQSLFFEWFKVFALPWSFLLAIALLAYSKKSDLNLISLVNLLFLLVMCLMLLNIAFKILNFWGLVLNISLTMLALILLLNLTYFQLYKQLFCQLIFPEINLALAFLILFFCRCLLVVLLFMELFIVKDLAFIVERQKVYLDYLRQKQAFYRFFLDKDLIAANLKTKHKKRR